MLHCISKVLDEDVRVRRQTIGALRETRPQRGYVIFYLLAVWYKGVRFE